MPFGRHTLHAHEWEGIVFIVTLLVLTVFLAHWLTAAARSPQPTRLPHFQPSDPRPYQAYARKVILSNGFWLWLLIGLALTLVLVAAVAVAVMATTV